MARFCILAATLMSMSRWFRISSTFSLHVRSALTRPDLSMACTAFLSCCLSWYAPRHCCHPIRMLRRLGRSEILSKHSFSRRRTMVKWVHALNAADFVRLANLAATLLMSSFMWIDSAANSFHRMRAPYAAMDMSRCATCMQTSASRPCSLAYSFHARMHRTAAPLTIIAITLRIFSRSEAACSTSAVHLLNAAASFWLANLAAMLRSFSLVSRISSTFERQPSKEPASARLRNLAAARESSSLR
mmetsp:Transcript_4645/g.20825  ORF Transcript_4645/g.20825 Transcript_4645/m.20825 type:complete len:245 (+) Transcript_4645:1969-2703(+)